MTKGGGRNVSWDQLCKYIKEVTEQIFSARKKQWDDHKTTMALAAQSLLAGLGKHLTHREVPKQW